MYPVVKPTRKEDVFKLHLETGLRLGERTCAVWCISSSSLPHGIDCLQVEVSEGKATSALRHPLPVQEGKVEALQMAFTSTRPTLAVGNSLDDGAMLGYARGFALVSNPNSAELESLARDSGWGIHRLEVESATLEVA